MVFSYRLAEKDGIYSVQHFSKSRKEWVENHSFENIPVPYSQFDRMHDLHYRVPGWGPFLTGIRVNRFWKNGGVVLRDFLATDPDGQFELKEHKELLEWLEKWFDPDFTEQIDLTRALKNLDIYKRRILGMETITNEVSFSKDDSKWRDFFNHHGWVVIKNNMSGDIIENGLLQWDDLKQKYSEEMGLTKTEYESEVSQWRNLWHSEQGVFSS